MQFHSYHGGPSCNGVFFFFYGDDVETSPCTLWRRLAPLSMSPNIGSLRHRLEEGWEHCCRLWRHLCSVVSSNRDTIMASFPVKRRHPSVILAPLLQAFQRRRCCKHSNDAVQAPFHTGEKRRFGRCCRHPSDAVTASFCGGVGISMMVLLATPLSASLMIGEDDATLASFGSHWKPF